MLELHADYSQYRSYKSHIPDYLHDRPKNVIVHCLQRRSKALKYTEEDVGVLDKEDGVFKVKGSKGKTHTVKIGVKTEDEMPCCTCADWQQWHIPCKHMFAVFNTQDGWTWNSFSPNYLNSPYLSCDSLSLKNHFHCTDDTDCIPSLSQTAPDEVSQSDQVSQLPMRKVKFPQIFTVIILYKPKKF